METTSSTRPWTTYENRCDNAACDSESFYRASKFDVDFDMVTKAIDVPDETQTLYFCGHHGYKHKVGLEAQGFIVEDWYHTINLAPSVSQPVDKS